MRSSFDPATTHQLEINFRGGFCDSFEEEASEFDEEVTRVFSIATEDTNALITSLTIEEYKLNFSELTKTVFQYP